MTAFIYITAYILLAFITAIVYFFSTKSNPENSDEIQGSLFIGLFWFIVVPMFTLGSMFSVLNWIYTRIVRFVAWILKY